MATKYRGSKGATCSVLVFHPYKTDSPRCFTNGVDASKYALKGHLYKGTVYTCGGSATIKGCKKVSTSQVKSWAEK